MQEGLGQRGTSVLSALQTGVLLLPIFLFGASPVRAAGAEGPLRWATYPDSVDELLALYPPRHTNDSAVDLERLVARLGIRLASPRAEGRPEPDAAASDAFRRIEPDLKDHRRTVLESPEDRAIKRVPPAIRVFLEEHSEDLAAIRERASLEPPPRWELRLDQDWEARREPSFVGYLNLQLLLLVDVLERAGRGDSRGAIEGLEASWALNVALMEDPDLLSQTVTLAVLRDQAAVLRHIDIPAKVWLERLGEHDFRESIMTGLWLRGFAVRQLEPPFWNDLEANPGPESGLLWACVAWILGMQDLAEGWKEHLVELGRIPEICGTDFSSLEEFESVASPWTEFVETAFPDSVKDLKKVARLEIELALTAKVLELRAHRAGTGSWPASLDGTSRWARCPQLRWRYERSPDDSVTVGLDPVPDWWDADARVYPAEFRLVPTDADEDVEGAR